MRRYGFALAVIAVLAPPLAHSQVQQANGQQVNDMSSASAPSADAVATRSDDNSIAEVTPERRSLMGMVMDVLIASAEQQSARQQTSRQPGRANAGVTRATAAPAASPSPSPAPSSDLPAREQIAVESKP